MELLVKQIMLEKEMCFNEKFFINPNYNFLTTELKANNKQNIINNLKNTKNVNFEFEQNINQKLKKEIVL